MSRLAVRPVAAREWPEVSSRFRDLTFEQTLAYGVAAAERIGATLECVAVENGSVPVAAAAVRVRTVPALKRGIAYIPAGPLLMHRHRPYPAGSEIRRILSAFKDHFVHYGRHILRVRPTAITGLDEDLFAPSAGETGFVCSNRASGYETVMIDLAPDEETLRARMKKDWRRRLLAALSAPLELECGRDDALWTRFIGMYEDTRARKDFVDNITPCLYRGLAGGDLDCEVLIARKDGRDLAGQIVATTPGVATSLFAATTLEGRTLGASHFLDWHCMLKLKQRDVRWLDLGGMDETTNPGGAQYKVRSGGVVVRAAGPYEATQGGTLSGVIANIEQIHRLARGMRVAALFSQMRA